MYLKHLHMEETLLLSTKHVHIRECECKCQKKKKCSGREHAKMVVVVILGKGSEIQGKGWE